MARVHILVAGNVPLRQLPEIHLLLKRMGVLEVEQNGSPHSLFGDSHPGVVRELARLRCIARAYVVPEGA